jgi:hypothetical protein
MSMMGRNVSAALTGNLEPMEYLVESLVCRAVAFERCNLHGIEQGHEDLSRDGLGCLGRWRAANVGRAEANRRKNRRRIIDGSCANDRRAQGSKAVGRAGGNWNLLLGKGC